MKALSIHRAIFYLLIGTFVLFAGIGGYFLKEKRAWAYVEEELLQTSYLSTLKMQKQSLNNLVRKQYCQADPMYLEHQFQGFRPLARERYALEKLTKTHNYTGAESIEKRLTFLNQGNNHLAFIEKNPGRGENLCETWEVMSHPIEVDVDDLKDILDIIEGAHTQKPQLIVRDFQLTRKTKTSGNEVYDLSMALIKREFES